MAEAPLHAGDPVVVGDRVIRPLARRSLASRETDDGFAVTARLVPVGVVVETPGEVRALDLDGEPIPFELSDPDGEARA